MKIDRLQHQGREPAVARDVRDDAPGEGEEGEGAVDEQDHLQFVFGNVNALYEPGIIQLQQKEGFALTDRTHGEMKHQLEMLLLQPLAFDGDT